MPPVLPQLNPICLHKVSATQVSFGGATMPSKRFVKRMTAMGFDPKTTASTLDRLLVGGVWGLLLTPSQQSYLKR